MKKLIPLLLIIVIPVLYSQAVSEKPIVKFPPNAQLDGYNFKFDPASSSYFYVQYDSGENQYSIIGNRGNSERYGYISAYNGLFDSRGNYYMSASNNITDTTYTYFLLKNGKETGKFDMINENWKFKDDKIYFVCRDNNGTYLASYNTVNGSLTKGKAYDNITLVYYEQNYSEGEQEGELGFTKDGKTYYLATLGGEKFLVIGDAEQKHYSDIDYYNFQEDKEGQMTYFAKDKGKFYESAGDAFVVQGKKEYGKKCDYLYGPILFDKDNNPVYICGDSIKDIYPQRVVTGVKEGKTYSGGVYDIRYTPSGKLIYTASDVVDQKKNIYRSFIVVEGKEGKKYNSVSSLTLVNTEVPLYAASKNVDESVIVNGTKEMETDYPNITAVQLMPDGSTAYIGAIYGDYKKRIKDKFFAVIHGDELGPYDGMVILNYENGTYILADNAGNYAYVIMNIKNLTDYVTTQQLVTPRYESKDFEGIDNTAFYKGKVLWTASRIVNRESYTYNYQVYYDNKPIGRKYDYIGDFKSDDKTGKVSFIGMTGNEFFTVEIQL